MALASLLSCHRGLLRDLAYMSQRAFRTDPVASEITPFSGPILKNHHPSKLIAVLTRKGVETRHRNWESPVRKSHVCPILLKISSTFLPMSFFATWRIVYITQRCLSGEHVIVPHKHRVTSHTWRYRYISASWNLDDFWPDNIIPASNGESHSISNVDLSGHTPRTWQIHLTHWDPLMFPEWYRLQSNPEYIGKSDVAHSFENSFCVSKVHFALIP